WRRREHRAAPPDADPRTQRRAEPPEAHRRGALCLGATEGRVQRDVPRAQSGDQTAGLNEQMRRRPERVAADRHVPRDVPVNAHHHTRSAEENGVRVPERRRTLYAPFGRSDCGSRMDRYRHIWNVLQNGAWANAGRLAVVGWYLFDGLAME